MKQIIFIFIIIIASVSFSENLGFAEFLFNEKDYFRCITELQREMHENQEADTLKISNLIAVCHINMGEYEKAIEKIEKLYTFSEDLEHNLLLSYFLSKRFDKIDEHKTVFDNNKTNLKHLSLIFQSKLKKSDTVEMNSDVKKIYNEYSKIKVKNSLIASLLSAVVPGLGRIYAERTGDALFSFMTVATPALISAYYYYYTENNLFFYTSLSITAAFYLGEIYGAYNSAKIHFGNKTEAFYKKFISDFSSDLLIPAYSF